MLAHHIKFDDNKLMINKFKDFLKNVLKRKSSDDSSDQDEILDEQSAENEMTQGLGEEDKTGETQLPDLSENDDEVEVPKTSWKDKFKISLPAF